MLIPILLFPLCLNCNAEPTQQWQRTYGSPYEERGNSIQVTSDGGFIVAGYTQKTYNGVDYDIYLVKTNSFGNMQWNKTYGGSGRDVGYSVAIARDGGYIVAGSTQSFNVTGSKVYLVKTDSSGRMQWNRTLGGPGWEEGYSIQATADGGYIVAGIVSGNQTVKILLVKTDSVGNTLWLKNYTGLGMANALSVQITPDGGFIVAGNTKQRGPGEYYLYLLKTDSEGTTQWDCTYGDVGEGYGFSVQVVRDGGYVMAGSLGFDACLVKTDASGKLVWLKTYGGSLFNAAHGLQVVLDGGFIVTGYTNSFDSKHVYVFKTDSLGNLQWQTAFGGGSESEWGYSVQVTPGGGYVVVGTTGSATTGQDVYLIKLFGGFGASISSDNRSAGRGKPITLTLRATNPGDDVISSVWFNVSSVGLEYLYTDRVEANNATRMSIVDPVSGSSSVWGVWSIRPRGIVVLVFVVMSGPGTPISNCTVVAVVFGAASTGEKLIQRCSTKVSVEFFDSVPDRFGRVMRTGYMWIE